MNPVKILFVTLIAFLGFGQLPLRTAPQIAPNPQASPVLNFSWKPSSDSNVTGYSLCWGTSSGNCTNQLDVGNVTTIGVIGLTPNLTYFFAVSSHTLTTASPPSNEVAFTPAQLNLSVQNLGLTSHFDFQVIAEGTYRLQATSDFQTWSTLLATNLVVDGLIQVDVPNPPGSPLSFFRLQRE